jgi:hypothetical protein
LGWCSNSEQNTDTLSQSIETGELVIINWNTFESSLIETWVIDIETQNSPQDIEQTKDIIWTTISNDEDIWKFLSNYLKELWRGTYKVAKSISKNNIITISMHKENREMQNHEDDYSYGYIDFIIKDNVIVRSNIAYWDELESKNWQWNIFDRGLVYRYTDQGVLFKTFRLWEMGGCGHSNTYYLTYVNLEREPKVFYSIFEQHYEPTTPEDLDNSCILSKEILQFFASSNNTTDELDQSRRNNNSLPIKAKTTEEAFYKYYKTNIR